MSHVTHMNTAQASDTTHHIRPKGVPWLIVHTPQISDMTHSDMTHNASCHSYEYPTRPSTSRTHESCHSFDVRMSHVTRMNMPPAPNSYDPLSRHEAKSQNLRISALLLYLLTLPLYSYAESPKPLRFISLRYTFSVLLYRVANMRRIPYLRRSFSAKEPYN